MSKSLALRMKEYEMVFRQFLPNRMPVIIRVDGRAFRTFMKGFIKPFDPMFTEVMDKTALELCKNIQNAKFAYVQSDEISIFLNSYECINTEPWFKNNRDKIITISSSMTTLFFNKILEKEIKFMPTAMQENVYNNKLMQAIFDGRAYAMPKEEVNNYFIWRQKDATRNSINMVGRTYFSHNQMKGKSKENVQEMLFQKHRVNWNDLCTGFKRGRCIISQKTHDGTTEFFIDREVPEFTKDRKYVETYVE